MILLCVHAYRYIPPYFFQEHIYYGYLFALGLFSSTLVSALLTTHFNYQVMCLSPNQQEVMSIYIEHSLTHV